MAASRKLTLFGALLALASVPALAQVRFSDSFTFLKAVREGDGDTVTRILEDPSTTAINARDAATGEAGLHIVVRRRDETWLTFLLGKGARPDIAANDGTTPLLLAAQIGWVEGAERLLRGRADVNKGNNRGETPLMAAVQNRDVAMVRRLLAAGADPNQTDNAAGLSALDYARRDSRAAALVRLLEDNGRARPAAVGPNR